MWMSAPRPARRRSIVASETRAERNEGHDIEAGIVQQLRSNDDLGMAPDEGEWAELEKNLRSHWSNLETIQNLMIQKGVD